MQCGWQAPRTNEPLHHATLHSPKLRDARTHPTTHVVAPPSAVRRWTVRAYPATRRPSRQLETVQTTPAAKQLHDPAPRVRLRAAAPTLRSLPQRPRTRELISARPP